MGLKVVESAGAEVVARRTFRDEHAGWEGGISARSRTPRSFMTAIRADLGEVEAYRHALLRGEVGLQRPFGANVPGVDFITAIRVEATGIAEVVCTDVKTSGRADFPAPKATLPGTWLAEVRDAVAPGRLRLGVLVTDINGPPRHAFPDPIISADLTALEAAIVRAVTGVPNRIRLRQLNADYSPAGQGRITGW
jgi:hypothetical protein